jgi:biuret amidohydrolase
MMETPTDIVEFDGSGHKLIRVRDRSDYRARMNALLTLDPGTTTVVTVDAQRDYLDLEVASCPATPSEAARVVRGTEALLAMTRPASIPVIHGYVVKTQAEFDAGVYGSPYSRTSTENRLSQNAWTGVREIPDRLAGTPQAEVYPTFVADGDFHVDSKRTNDACFQTHLPLLLERVTHAKTVLLAGVNTDSCVFSTAYSLSNLGYRVVVIEDCVASTRGVDHHVMALELMSRSFCWVMTVDEVREKLRGTLASAARARTTVTS